MTDRQTLEELFLARHPLVTIQTFEEEYVLTVLGEMAVERQVDMWMWSATEGMRDGLLSESPAIADTDHAAAALYWVLRQSAKPALFVFCDLIGHLKDERTLRCLREAADHAAHSGGQLIVLDHSDALPPVVAARAARFIPSLPDEHEIESLIRNTVRELNEERRIEVHLNREELQTVVRNLQGLSRRQATQVIRDVVCVDCRLDASDINRMLARKRQAIAGDGLLDFVESPVNLDEIGGLNRLKAWLELRKQCASDAAAEVVAMATDLFDGTRDAAVRWLNTPQPALAGQIPSTLLSHPRGIAKSGGFDRPVESRSILVTVIAKANHMASR